MSNTAIQLKKSGVTGNTPTGLANGELALNFADGKLYYKNSLGGTSYISNQFSFDTINANSSLVLATSGSDTLSFVAGNNVTISTNTTTKTITINSSGGSTDQFARDVANLGYAQANAAFNKANTYPGNSNQILYKNSSNVLTSSSGLSYDGVSLRVNGNLESTFQSGDEGGEIFLSKSVNNTTLTTGISIDVYQNKLRIFETGGSNRGVYIDIANGASGGIGTNLLAPPGGSVTSVAGATGAVSNTQLIAGLQTVSSSYGITFDYVATANNGQGTNFKVGDDAWIGDFNTADSLKIKGQQNALNGYVSFGSNTSTLGAAGTGQLTYGGNIVWHAGNDGVGSGLDADLLDGLNSSDFARASAESYANSAFSAANTSGSYANSAFTTANNALPKSGGTVTGNVTLSTTSTMIIQNTRPTTSNSTGALIVDGGLAVKGNTWVSGIFTVDGDFSVGNQTTSGNVINNGLVTFTQQTNFTNTNPSTSTTTGAILVSGGAGVQKTVYAGNLATSGVITPSVGSTSSNGIIWPSNPGGGSGDVASIKYYVVTGEQTRLEINNQNDGVGVSQDDIYLTTPSYVVVNSTRSATSTTDAALLVLGGVGVSGNIYSGAIRVQNTTPTISNSTGAMIVEGGAAVKGNLWVSGLFTVDGDFQVGNQNTTGNVYNTGNVTFTQITQFTSNAAATSNSTGAVIVTGGVGVKGNVYTGAIRITGSTANGITFADGTVQYTANGVSNVAVASYSAANSAALYANGAFSASNSASTYANGAFLQSNSAFAAANSASLYANAAFAAANSGSSASFAFSQANAAFNQANSSFGASNSASLYANGAFTAANTADGKATSAGLYANAAFAAANSGSSSSFAFGQANAAFAQANAAFAAANTSGTLTGYVDVFTADGTGNNYTLSTTPSNKNITLVAVQGVLQPKASYNISGTALTFDSTPPSTAYIEVTTLVGAGGGGTGGSSITWYIVNANTTMVTSSGYFVDTTNGPKTMTLPASATLGDTIRINDLAGNFASNNLTVARNSHKIQGLAEDLVVDMDQSSFGLVYSNTTYGWKVLEL
jgi:hypothetical protein